MNNGYNKTFGKTRLEGIKVKEANIYKFNINENDLLKILKNILTDFCDANIIGYNKKTNKHWCKMYNNNNNNCEMYIELEIMFESSNTTMVRFITLIGSNSLIERFVLNFKESIELYLSSTFIKSCLENGY
jgi:hypothetical protein